ncbi:MAG: hypothetical protein FWC03_02740 [Treponema sp.]|nr:hypothetical protein [Treponema sp.]
MKISGFALSGYSLILAVMVLAGTAAAGYAQVNQDELQQDLPPVVFINYEGPHVRIDTREQIRQIGVVLGNQIPEINLGASSVSGGFTDQERAQYSSIIQAGARNRYFVIHCLTGNRDGKIDADIFGLGVDVGVDHIRNLRTIIQGYLQAAYNYSERDASLLAQYITIYNAVYRGNWDYFSNRYAQMVLDNLISDRTGLSIRYDEWPGRTLMLIPIGYGGLSSVDTSVITDSLVIEELRREEDRGIPLRMEIVELKEREAEEAEQAAQAEREAIRQEEREIAEERMEAAQERQEIQQERQQVQQEQQAGTITPEQARETEQELDRREQAVEQREQEIERREEVVEQRREEAQRLEEFAQEKAEEAQQDREEIARDQQEGIINQNIARTESVPESGIIGVTIERQSPTILGRLILSTASGRELRRSASASIHVRTITFTGGRIIAIAGENTGSSTVRLVEIDQNNLEILRQGNDDIMTGSLIWVNTGDLYAITVNSGDNSCYLGRFDANLTLQAKSSVRVHPNASVLVQQGYLMTQRDNGSVLLLNPANLTESR